MDKQKIDTLFDYSYGKLFWKVKKSRNINVGDEAGSSNNEGYKVVLIDRKQYKIHRLIFCMFYGYFPEFVDHIDGNPSNNDISNLRKCTKSQNQHNTKLHKNNKTGVHGLSLNARNGKWLVQLQVDKRKKRVGEFEDFELAELVAIEARNKYHGEFARK